MRTIDSAIRRLPVAQCLVACNIYVSVGHPRWATFLSDVLSNAHEECRRLRLRSSNDIGELDSLAVVHAYADGPYDRSSFHLAGSSPLVAQLASHIAVNAVKGLQERLATQKREQESSLDSNHELFAMATAHPTVGLVDHVAVLPLTLEPDNVSPSTITIDEWTRSMQGTGSPKKDSNQDLLGLLHPSTPTTSSGWVARTVGMALQQVGVDVLWYGHADPLNTPLAHVRKTKTRFFEALPSSTSSSSAFLGQSTVGAPPHFVENYNIQLETTNKTTASSLTKWIRSREGGLPFVEALTLPHGQDPVTKAPYFEVACNLLHPSVTSVEDVEKRVQEWTTIQDDKSAVEYHGYRVGSTMDMCRKALEVTKTLDQEDQYNHRVRTEFERFLQQSIL